MVMCLVPRSRSQRMQATTMKSSQVLNRRLISIITIISTLFLTKNEHNRLTSGELLSNVRRAFGFVSSKPRGGVHWGLMGATRGWGGGGQQRGGGGGNRGGGGGVNL